MLLDSLPAQGAAVMKIPNGGCGAMLREDVVLDPPGHCQAGAAAALSRP